MPTRQAELVDFSTNSVCLKSREVTEVTLSQIIRMKQRGSSVTIVLAGKVILILCSVTVTQDSPDVTLLDVLS